MPVENPYIIGSNSFLEGHPDTRWRNEALSAYKSGDMTTAYRKFRRAARYADKPSQAMVAEMLWEGTGIGRDRPLAYAWMDLAAERQQRDFLIRREYYWSKLTEDERRLALAAGKQVYADFSDEVAKPRHDRESLRVLRSVTGSRLGWTGNMSIYAHHFNRLEAAPIDGALFFDSRYWKPEAYWEWQDQLWQVPTRGIVEVLPIQADHAVQQN